MYYYGKRLDLVRTGGSPKARILLENAFPDDNLPKLQYDYAIVFPKYGRDVSPDVHADRREIVRKLKNAGLIISKSYSTDDDEIYIKITASEDLLEAKAEVMGLEMILKEEYGGGYAPFTRSTKHRFLGAGRRFFNPAERIKIIVFTIEAEKQDGGAEVTNLRQLRQEGKVVQWFALHDEKARRELMRSWVRGLYLTKPPLEKVREYFGERVAMYFGFLSFYTRWLLCIFLVGVVAAVLKALDLGPPISVQDPQTKETIIVRPHSHDGIATPIYCILIGVAVTLFLEYWKRRQAELCYDWNQQNFEAEEKTRVEYIGRQRRGFWSDSDWIPLDDLDNSLYNFPKSMLEDKHASTRREVVAGGLSIIAVLIVAVMAVCVSLLGLRTFLYHTVGSFPSSIIGGLLFTISIQLFNFFYGKLAVYLNDRENHRTDTDYQDALIFKVFLFQFVNSYVSFFYVAYVKNAQLTVFGVQERCISTIPGGPPNCMYELQRQIQSVFFFQIALGNIIEVFIPFIKRKLKSWNDARRAAKQGENLDKQVGKAQRESQMAPYETPFWDYNEMIIQFGYVTLFASASPLAPLFALLNNLIELRSDAYKITCEFQRPPVYGAQDIGTWMGVLEMMSVLSVINNCLLLCFTSSTLTEWVWPITEHPYFVKFVICVALEHAIFAIKILVERFIPDVPFKVRVKAAKQTFLLTCEKKKELITALQAHEVQSAGAEHQAQLYGPGYVTEDTEDDEP
mmetsp:Transcript_21883/g.36229  ORF Transcript_21883/g.36229 Transcript_21883/m.36229 type:complete len:738 (+) Transcript_21883:131-2344(+)|eukprot:CAMPEP_0184649180 /NCGR_PEP_ID=MMETSP0308-20130426/6473_1 /TAXON_ID=38269 /ORGANISM="Gloeochaete witrockiana, Strain SAG 46.84" /LENGTH=737 /DNA_ID=CAMNT_0027081681 /DNA_START=39 /DNA_END=2252 /DNA_ORIENTATION=+